MPDSWNSPPDDPLVSVIIPVYNGEEFILEAIESALAQTWKNLEVIVVDDGSTDATLRLLTARAADEPRLQVLTQANGGVARARNHALAVARGSLIAPLDADDLWEPTKIERQVKRMAEGGAQTAMVYSGWVWIDEGGRVVDRSPRWEIEGRVFHALVEINFTGNASIPLFRRQALREIGGYNPALGDAGAGGCEDWEVALRIARRYHVLCVPDALVGYRRRPGSMSTDFNRMWRSRQLMIELLGQTTQISGPVLRRSERQYCLYLAGVAFWAGSFRTAIVWGLRSGIRLPIAVLPYVVRMLAERLLLRLGLRRSRRQVQTMSTGVPLQSALLPRPHIDYARIYAALPDRVLEPS